MAAELKHVRSRLSLQEQSYVKETLTRQEVEAKAKSMQEEIARLQKNLDERNGELQTSTSNTEKCLKELDDLRSQLTFTQAAADSSAASAESAQIQCSSLLKELDEKNNILKQQEERLKRMEEQLDNLQMNLAAREASQKQLREEVVRVEHDIMQTLNRAGVSNSQDTCELRKLLDEISPKNLANMDRLLTVKDEEISRLRDEIKILSAHWRFKTKELESQLERQRKTDQELKKRVLKLEFCLQEARSQTRKLQRTGERRDKAIKELRDQMMTKQQPHLPPADCCGGEKPNFWESSSFKVMVSMSMLVLVVFSKR